MSDGLEALAQMEYPGRMLALGKTKDLLSAFEALITLDDKAIDKVKRVIPANKITNAYELAKKVID